MPVVEVRSRHTLLAALLGGLLLVAVSGSASACPSCKGAIGSDKSGRTATAYFWSILFMLGTPFALAGGYGLMFYRICRTAARQSSVRWN